MQEPIVLLESYVGGKSYRFDGLKDVVVATKPKHVFEAIERLSDAVDQGFHAAGYISYEAASGFDERLVTRDAGHVPLVWFGIFENRTQVVAGDFERKAYSLSDWQPSLSRDVYDDKMRQIRDYIVAGDTYQVNYTFRLRAEFEGDPRGFYASLCNRQRTDFAGFLNTGRFQILSASPELFFRLRNGVLTTRPMKGTWPRGRWVDEDERHRHLLYESEKNRAENVMIVDLLRNDMGRVSQLGSVAVTKLWDVEQYETVFQMTSTVTSQVKEGVGIRDILGAMFPCGSVTGAPKVRTMEIISEVESLPRGVYTGSIGYISPGGEACFNVAIRTVCVDRETGLAEFGVGGGVTYDSSSDGEYDECLTKARVLTSKPVDFDLFETMRYDVEGGYFLLSRHLERLTNSARYFGFVCDTKKIEAQLQNASQVFGKAMRVRCVLTREGEIKIETVPLAPSKKQTWKVGFAKSLVNSQEVWLYHKTTQRVGYASRLKEQPDCDEVILFNERGELTECTIGNLVVEKLGKKLTPPVSSGLLGGTFRAELLVQGVLEETVLTQDDVYEADALYMINSVREWVPLTLID